MHRLQPQTVLGDHDVLAGHGLGGRVVRGRHEVNQLAGDPHHTHRLASVEASGSGTNASITKTPSSVRCRATLAKHRTWSSWVVNAKKVLNAT
jgi:hypothetical protein